MGRLVDADTIIALVRVEVLKCARSRTRISCWNREGEGGLW